MDDQDTSRFEFVTKKTSDSHQFFRAKRSRNRLAASVFVGAAASLSAIATVALGASKMMGAEWLALAALIAIASGLATITGASEILLANRKLWHINNTALAALDGQQLNLDYRKTDQQLLTTAEIDRFYQRFKKILGEADKAWVETFTPK